MNEQRQITTFTKAVSYEIWKTKKTHKSYIFSGFKDKVINAASKKNLN